MRFLRMLGMALAVGAALPVFAQRAEAPPTAASAAAAHAAAVCSVCHGSEGRATNHGYFPRIAGKPEGYIYEQLLAFRDGRRQYAAMTHLLQVLSDDYLHEIARYFADQQLPYPLPQTAGAPVAVLALGEQLVRRGDPARQVPACIACHGAAMTGVRPFVPGLIGLPRDYLNAQLGAWKTGLRHARAPDCMARVVLQLTPADVTAISTWLSSQPVPADARAVAEPPTALAAACGSVSGGLAR